MATVSVSSPAGEELVEIVEGARAADILTDSDVVVARINGDLRDLATPLVDGDVVEGVDIGSDDGRAVLRHSTAHVLAQAVQDIFPGTKLGIGPPIKDGFYYDFDPERSFTPEDLDKISKRMQQIVKEGQRFAGQDFQTHAADRQRRATVCATRRH